MTAIRKLAEFIHAGNTSGQKCGYAGSTMEDIIHDLGEGLAESAFTSATVCLYFRLPQSQCNSGQICTFALCYDSR